MRSSAQIAMMTGFAVALIILLVVGFVAMRDSSELSDLNSEVNLTHEIIADTKDVLGSLTDSETAIRGYVLSRNAEFLQTYYDAQGRLEKALPDLQTKVKDPEATAILKDFTATVHTRNNRFPVGLDLVKQGPFPQEVITSRIGEGKRIMDEVRATGARLQQRELALLEMRIRQAHDLSRRTRIVIGTGSILAVLFLSIASVIVNLDLKRRLDVEGRLRQTGTLQRAILNSANYSIISTGPDGIIRTFNTAAQRWLQYSSEEMVGRNTPGIFHDFAEMKARAEELSMELGHPVDPGFEVFIAKAKTGERDEREWTYVRKNGSRFPVLLSISALYDTWGEVTGYLGVASDITERKAAEQALRKAEETFRTLLQESSDIVTILNPDGTMKYVSPAVERLVGYKVETLTNASVFDYLHPDDLRQSKEALQYASQGQGHAVPHELRLRRSDGSFVWMELVANKLLHDPHIDGIVINARDITARHQMEQMKRDFISTVSHELRTPLTSLHGALGLLASGKLGEISDKGRRMLEIAVKSTDRLVRLVNDILDIERLDSGAVRMEIRPVSAAEVVTQAADIMRAMADTAGVQIKVVRSEVLFTADSDRLIQMLTNLLSNAIKFSDRGGIVTVAAEPQGEFLHLTVKDQGRGIPASKLETVFERFQQVDASDSREKGGTGLGLSICRLIAQQHGGRIWAESIEGQGSTFHVELPLRSGDRKSVEEEVSSV